jgi:hypothetical protein
MDHCSKLGGSVYENSGLFPDVCKQTRVGINLYLTRNGRDAGWWSVLIVMKGWWIHKRFSSAICLRGKKTETNMWQLSTLWKGSCRWQLNGKTCSQNADCHSGVHCLEGHSLTRDTNPLVIQAVAVIFVLKSTASCHAAVNVNSVPPLVRHSTPIRHLGKK